MSSSLVLQRRMKYSGGQGKTINKSGKTVSGIKFDINALNLMCRYVISDNAHVRRSQLFRLRNLLEIMDMTEYMNQPQLMDKIEFIRKALYGRLEKSINETDILIRYISGGLMEEDIEVDRRPLTTGEVEWVNETISGCLKYAFIYDDIDRGIELYQRFKAADYRSREEIVNQIEEHTKILQNKFRKARNDAARDEVFSLENDIFENSVREAHADLTNPSSMLFTGVTALNEMLGGGLMSGRIYTLFGLPGEGKSMTMLDIALQVKKYNKNIKTKDPTKKPCILFLTMENGVRETIQRIFSISTKGEDFESFDVDQAVRILKEEGELVLSDEDPINIFIKYAPQMSQDTSYLYTLTEDLEDEGWEVIFCVQDYLKKIHSTERLTELRLELGLIVEEFKVYAAIKDIPVLTASQMNRDAIKAIEDNRRKNGANSVTLVGGANIGESTLILDNSDMVIMLAKENTKNGKFMGFKRIKSRYKVSDKAEIYHPYEPNSPALVQDLGRVPVSKETMNDQVNVALPGQSHRINNVTKFEDMIAQGGLMVEDDLFAETMHTPNIRRVAMTDYSNMITPVRFIAKKENDGYLIHPVTFTSRKL